MSNDYLAECTRDELIEIINEQGKEIAEQKALIDNIQETDEFVKKKMAELMVVHNKLVSNYLALEKSYKNVIKKFRGLK